MTGIKSHIEECYYPMFPSSAEISNRTIATLSDVIRNTLPPSIPSPVYYQAPCLVQGQHRHLLAPHCSRKATLAIGLARFA